MPETESLLIKKISSEDIPLIIEGFAKSGWTEKSTQTLESYHQEQQSGKRIVWVAYLKGDFAGYVTLKWHSDYQFFSKDNIPEISDLNVLPTYRKRGIASKLLDLCESEASTKSKVVGIGVGLYADYGNAQILYVKRGYIPDGNGVTYSYSKVQPGTNVIVDDDFILWFKKVF